MDAFIEIEKYAHLLFGRLAIDKGFITYQQLLEVLQSIHDIPKRRIGEVFVKKGFLTREQVKAILLEQEKFSKKKPFSWPFIPNTVLKGLLYCGFSLGKVKIENIRFAEKAREKKRHRTLCEVLTSVQLTTEKELKKFQKQIETSNWQCPDCDRIYLMFNYDPALEKIPCPVCWEPHLILEGSKKPAKNAPKKTPPKAPEKPKKDIGPIVSNELAQFYASLDNMEGPAVKKTEKAIETTMPMRKMEPKIPQLTMQMDVLGDTQPKIVAAKKKEDAGAKKEQAVAKSDVKISSKASLEMQKIYEMMEQQEEERVAKNPNAIATPKGQQIEVSFGEKKIKKNLEALKVFAMVATIVIIAGGGFLFYLYQKPKPKLRKSIIVKMESAPKPVPKKKEVKIDVAKINKEREEKALQKVLAALNTSKVSQAVLNKALRYVNELLQCSSNSPYIADYYNLKARILFSMVFNDEYGQFSFKKTVKLARKAQDIIIKARDIYQKNTTKTKFSLQLMPWMWDAKKENVKPWQKKLPKLVYENVFQGREDAQRFLMFTRSFIAKERYYASRKKS